MSVSIGATGSGLGPRGAIASFGEQTEGRAFDWRVVARLLAYLRPHSQRMAIALALTLAASALTLVAPYLIKVAIDQHIA